MGARGKGTGARESQGGVDQHECRPPLVCSPVGASSRIICSPMPIALAEKVGRDTTNTLAAFGDFCQFVARVFAFLPSIVRWKNMRLLFPQMYEVGVRSVPVVGVTGAFIGMVLA